MLTPRSRRTGKVKGLGAYPTKRSFTASLSQQLWACESVMRVAMLSSIESIKMRMFFVGEQIVLLFAAMVLDTGTEMVGV